MNDRLEYMTDVFIDWTDALKEASNLSEDGWMIMSALESDEYVRLVFGRQVQKGRS